MAEFFFAYHSGKMPETPEEGEKLMKRWQAWMGEHQAAFKDPGNPVGMSKTVSAAGVADNGGPDPLAGYSIVEAESIDAAIEIAKGCPHLDHGTIEVAPVVHMEM